MGRRRQLWLLDVTILLQEAAATARLEEFVAKLLAFPGRHDDQVDALTQRIAFLGRSELA
jgi:hypothetical protein